MTSIFNSISDKKSLLLQRKTKITEEYKKQNSELLERLRRGEFPGTYWLDFTGGLPGGGGVGGARQQRRGEGEGAVGVAYRQIEHPGRVWVLAVDRRVGRPVGTQRQGDAHVQLQIR